MYEKKRIEFWGTAKNDKRVRKQQEVKEIGQEALGRKR